MFQFRDRFSLKRLMVIIFLLGSSFSRNIEPLQKLAFNKNDLVKMSFYGFCIVN